MYSLSLLFVYFISIFLFLLFSPLLACLLSPCFPLLFLHFSSPLLSSLSLTYSFSSPLLSSPLLSSPFIRATGQKWRTHPCLIFFLQLYAARRTFCLATCQRFTSSTAGKAHTHTHTNTFTHTGPTSCHRVVLVSSSVHANSIFFHFSSWMSTFRIFLQDLQGCLETPERVGACFLQRVRKYEIKHGNFM